MSHRTCAISAHRGRACVQRHAQITREEARADHGDESPRVQPHRWRSQSQSLTSSYHSSARGDQLIVRSSAPSRPSSIRPSARPSAAVGHQRLRSRVIVARRPPVGLPSPVRAVPCAFPPCTGVRQYGCADGGQRTFFPLVAGAVYRRLGNAAPRVVPPCRRAGSSRPTTTYHARANAGASGRPRRDDPASGAADRIDVNVAARRVTKRSKERVRHLRGARRDSARRRRSGVMPVARFPVICCTAACDPSDQRRVRPLNAVVVTRRR